MTFNEIETYIFDLDGVLIDSLADLCDSVNFTLRTFGMKEMPNESIREYIGKGNRNLIMQVFKTQDAETVGRTLSVFMDHYAKNCTNKTVLRKGVTEMLDRIKDRDLAILSNKFAGFTEIITKELNIHDYFGIILGPDRLEKMKPDPEGINKIIEFFGSSPVKTIVIGDSDIDITTGKNAGTITCGVLGGIGNERKLKESCPDFLVNEVYELFDCFCIANK
jgi:phosphoglycolate phosphatase